MSKILLKANPNNKFLIWLQTRLTNLETTFISLKSQVSQNSNDIEQLKKGGGGGSTITVDSELSSTSTNPVQNKVITEKVSQLESEISAKADIYTLDSYYTKTQIKNNFYTKTEIDTMIGDIESILSTVVEV